MYKPRKTPAGSKRATKAAHPKPDLQERKGIEPETGVSWDRSKNMWKVQQSGQSPDGDWKNFHFCYLERHQLKLANHIAWQLRRFAENAGKGLCEMESQHRAALKEVSGDLSTLHRFVVFFMSNIGMGLDDFDGNEVQVLDPDYYGGHGDYVSFLKHVFPGADAKEDLTFLYAWLLNWETQRKEAAAS